ncbi:MAG TPA: 16S rRNA (adenine(1518)-N(6)/adenine(1519)-N(6))-dimethyltransferase RsmA [Bacillota bacterium]|nr:16S rRNA (adenine(1518)-N(6)/adenine(1519)-N(6))-dimethyltransferase RsmA [Bacillota bacterium]
MKNRKYIATPSRTKEILATHDFSFKKSLGQNFLIDVNVLKNIVKHAGISNESGVIEIGPGIGSLTEQLAIHAKKVIAYEIDQRLEPLLAETLQAYENIELIFTDILEANIHEVVKKHFSHVADIHIVANLPYYITTPIIMKLLEDKLPITRLTMMTQKEVAVRMSALPSDKDYGSLSIAVQYYTKAKTVMDVSRHVFMPKPNVDSAVLTLTVREKPPVEVIDEPYFFAIVRASFAQRRKTLRNNLISYFKDRLPRKVITNTIQRAGIDGQRRGETLTIQEFAMLANAFYHIEHR